VAIQALSSPVTAITLLASFAAPLLAFSSLNEGFIINLAGRSSAGKSTANRLAASVWGHPDQHPSRDSTARSLAELGAASSDMPLILDDTDQNSDVAPAKRLLALFKAVDALAAGQGRSYSNAVESSLPDLQFHCIGLSSSPETMEAFSPADQAAQE
jgi:putative DNA primase/helicase